MFAFKIFAKINFRKLKHNCKKYWIYYKHYSILHNFSIVCVVCSAVVCSSVPAICLLSNWTITFQDDDTHWCRLKSFIMCIVPFFFCYFQKLIFLKNIWIVLLQIYFSKRIYFLSLFSFDIHKRVFLHKIDNYFFFYLKIKNLFELNKKQFLFFAIP